QPVLLGGKEHQQEAADNLPPNTINLVGQTLLHELLALLQEMSVLITTDSGPMHAGYLVGIPVIPLIGPTHPRRVVPPYGLSKEVYAAVSCSPCYKKKCEHTICWSHLSADDIMLKVNELKKGTSSCHE
ncbi:MAG: hypothetical protein L7F78_27595, partial [Syntrophales bacterium LBB04]|nr:hypothetical protein [Syntrophales bacterium LBB04]